MQLYHSTASNFVSDELQKKMLVNGATLLLSIKNLLKLKNDLP